MISDRELDILKLLDKGNLTAKQIANSLNISTKYAYKLLKRLIEKGLVTKYNLEYSITPQGRVLLRDDVKKVRVHNIWVTADVHYAPLEILEELSYKIVEMRNWRAYLINVADVAQKLGLPPLNAKVRVNMGKNLTAIVYLPPFYATNRNEASMVIHNMYNNVGEIMAKAGVVLDKNWRHPPKFIFAEYAIETDFPLEPGTEVTLPRKAEDPEGKKLPIQARIWVDESFGREFETNCSRVSENYLLMPDRVENIEKMSYKILQNTEKIEQKLSGYDGFLVKVSEVTKNMTEAGNVIAEASKNLALNINSHIPYVQSAEKALTELSKVAQSLKVFIILLGFIMVLITVAGLIL